MRDGFINRHRKSDTSTGLKKARRIRLSNKVIEDKWQLFLVCVGAENSATKRGFKWIKSVILSI